ncbi:MAG: hypothetical protein SFT94_11305 [Pseudanabaenaceae cyanobacterium bins.68]|nr:hypothetical protein [Pseudanabaenaceae cyanobacterium bins.68]
MPKISHLLSLIFLVTGLNINPVFGTPRQVTETLAAIAQRNTNTSARTNQLQRLRQKLSPIQLDLSSHPLAKTQYWQDLLWAIAVLEPQQPLIAQTLKQILESSHPPALTTLALRVAHQLYTSDAEIYQDLAPQLTAIAEQSQNSEWVAMAIATLGDQGISNLGQRFDLNLPSHLRLATTLQPIPASNPPLTDLLNHQIAPNQPHLFVLCQRNRDQLCQAILRDRQGEFWRSPNGQMWQVPLLSQSLHRLPWNFTHGHTPQGIYRLEGTEPAQIKTLKDLPTDTEFQAYGQFPLVKLFMPFEPQVKQFLPDQAGAFKGRIEQYQNLLPPSWRDHLPLQQSYWAGKLGRSFIRIHGTGFSDRYFRADATPTPGWNPALGCLSAQELYDQTGKLIQADMPQILQALTQASGGNINGYAIVVELDPQSWDQFQALVAIAK